MSWSDSMRRALDGMPALVPEWPAPESVRAFVTTRAGGVSEGAYASLNLGTSSGDDGERVRRNRDIVRRRLPSEPLWMKQVHGVEVADADTWPGPQAPTADAAIASAPGRVCTALTADCLPLFVCDEDGAQVAVAHAGWRGLAAGVVENTVARFRAPPGKLLAWMGPAIGPKAFEVGPEVRDAFVKAEARAAEAFWPHREGKYLADLYALARQRLARAGVARVFGGGFCTFNDAQTFFSYRREKMSGRMGAFIWRL